MSCARYPLSPIRLGGMLFKTLSRLRITATHALDTEERYGHRTEMESIVLLSVLSCAQSFVLKVYNVLLAGRVGLRI